MSLSAAQYWMLVPDWFVYFSMFGPAVCCAAVLWLTLVVRRFAVDIEREMLERERRMR